MGAGLEGCMCRVSYSSYVNVSENHVPKMKLRFVLVYA